MSQHKISELQLYIDVESLALNVELMCWLQLLRKQSNTSCTDPHGWPPEPFHVLKSAVVAANVQTNWLD